VEEDNKEGEEQEEKKSTEFNKPELRFLVFRVVEP
jgi:hypothetical protein